MPRKFRQVRRDLRHRGFTIMSQESSHEKWGHLLIPDKIVVAGHDGDDVPRYLEKQLRDILAKLDEAERRRRS